MAPLRSSLRRLLSSIGVGGSVDVDADVSVTREVVPGETIDIDLRLSGGRTARDVDAVSFSLETDYRADDGSRETATITETESDDGFTIRPDARRSFTASMDVPRVTPLTRHGVSVSLRTGLAIDGAVHPIAETAVEVVPDHLMTAVLEAVESVEFAPSGSQCKAGWGNTGVPFAQTFTFEPTGPRWRRDVDELEVVFLPDSELPIRLDVDPRETPDGDRTGSGVARPGPTELDLEADDDGPIGKTVTDLTQDDPYIVGMEDLTLGEALRELIEHRCS